MKSLSFSGIIQPLHSKTQLNLELASMFPGLQCFNKRAVLKQIRTKTEKKRNYSCLFSLFIPEKKDMGPHQTRKQCPQLVIMFEMW